MIHVELKAEPASFDTNVRQPGNAFLAGCPNPVNDDWKRHRYWSKCSSDLYAAYGGICAYTGRWFSKLDTAVSVDHFYPKYLYPEKAYEWDNYRLTTSIMNNYKGDKILLDPFEIENGDLYIEFPSCLVKPRKDMAPGLKNKAILTIQTLKLNEEDQVEQRCDIILEYISGNISGDFLARRYPFIDSELRRQDLYEEIKNMFKQLH